MGEELSLKDIRFEPHSNIHKIIITQVIVLFLILVGILTVKYTNSKNYKKITEFYNEYFCDDTSVSEVLEEDSKG